ncbi:MAG TPA: GDP-L-fucose synthase [Thermodesulfobacteriota bacterium]|nr:GDP-L-fucose synthase [Thermodesulfobacteriota bacterium]
MESRSRLPIDRKSKIYVAGHTGLVGSALLRKLQSEAYTNLVTRTHAELNLTRQAEVEKFFDQERPDYIFLAAAKVGGILANSAYKAQFIYENLLIAANVIQASHKFGVKKLLNLGSSCIYPKFAPQPLKEEYLLTGPLEPTNEPYAVAKIAAIKLCQYYNEQYGANFISAMPTNLYGPNDNFDLETSHVLPALIRKMHLGKCLQKSDFNSIRKDLQKCPMNNYDATPLRDEEIVNLLSKFGIKSYYSNNSPLTTHHSQLSTVVELWGTGSPYREFLHVDDLADACLFLIDNYDASLSAPGSPLDFVNVGTGDDLKIKDLAQIVKDIVGFDGELRWDTSKPDGTPRKLLDVSKIKTLGWAPKITLEEGIKKTYEWYLSQNA